MNMNLNMINNGINMNNPFIPPQKPVFKPMPNPSYLKAIFQDQESEQKIMGAVKRLAGQMGEQSRIMLQNQKFDMEEKLRLLEFENALKREEHNRLARERLEIKREKSIETQRKGQKKKKESGNSDMLDLISKMLLIQEYGKGNSRTELSPERDRSEYDYPDQYYSNSPRKKNKLPPINEKKKKKKRVTKIYMNDDDDDYDQDYDGYDYEYEDQDDSDNEKEKSSKKKKTRKTIIQDTDPKNKEPADKKAKRAKAKSNLRWILWGMLYPQVLFGDVRHKVESRKKDIHNQMERLIQVNFNAAISFILKYAEPEIIKLVSSQKSLELYVAGKNLNEKEFDARADIIVGNYKRLFDKICSGTKEQNFSPNFLRFLAFISEDGGVPPSGFMFDFEIKRFMFTYYATLKNMTSVMSKMVLGCFILLRVLLHKLIMRPWENISSVTEKKTDKKSLLSIGSLLYHTVLDLFRGTVPTHKDNQVFLLPDLKIKPSATQLTAIDLKDNDDEGKAESKNKEAEPIKGFYSKELIMPFFKNKKNDELKKIIEGWLEQMYLLTHDVYSRASKEEKEILGLPK